MSLQSLKVSFVHWDHEMPSPPSPHGGSRPLSLLLSQFLSPRMCTPPPNSAVGQKPEPPHGLLSLPRLCNGWVTISPVWSQLI